MRLLANVAKIGREMRLSFDTLSFDTERANRKFDGEAGSAPKSAIYQKPRFP